MKKFYILFLILLFISLGCLSQTKISDLYKYPEKYNNTKVRINAFFKGWSYCKGAVLLTKSDITIYDDTGCIEVSGLSPYAPTNNSAIGKKVTIEGIVKYINGKPIIVASKE